MQQKKSFLKWLFRTTEKHEVEARTNPDAGKNLEKKTFKKSARQEMEECLKTGKNTETSHQEVIKNKVSQTEHLSEVVRQSFTHSGVLSATYRFKLLLTDREKNQFTVMVDIEKSFDHRAEKLAEIEAKIIQMAEKQYEISVKSVYWRVSVGEHVAPKAVEIKSSLRRMRMQRTEPVKTTPEKISDGHAAVSVSEIEAFRRALTETSGDRPLLDICFVKMEENSESLPQATSFADTEIQGEQDQPVLSSTQYAVLRGC